jgi:hypothetical protein
MEESKKPTIRRRKDDPPFRRKEDELKFNLFDRFLSLMKWLILLVMIILFFFYQTISSQNQTDQYQIKLLNELTEKVNAMANQKNTTNFPIPGACLVCHAVNSQNELRLKHSYTLTEFNDYIRGKYRPISNSTMPNFDSSIISDIEIEKIYNYLKYK